MPSSQHIRGGVPLDKPDGQEGYAVTALSCETPEPVETVRLFGVPFSRISFDTLCRLIASHIKTCRSGFIVTPNVDHVCRFQKDPALREAYERSWLRVVDSQPLLLVSYLLGCPLPAKLSGSDLVYSLSEFAARNGYSVFFFGAAEGVAEEAAAGLQAKYPGLKVAGCYSPPMGFEKSEDTNTAAIHAIRNAKPDICFVALGAPKQEIWMAQNIERLDTPIGVAVGGAFDMAAGRVQRAPKWMQSACLEWAWRLALEPGRLWRRYFVDDIAIVGLIARELLNGVSRCWFDRQRGGGA